MSCCFLLYYYRQDYHDPLQTLRFYAQQRTSNEKVDECSTCRFIAIEVLLSCSQGVTIPSQRRYVEYLGHLLNSQVPYSMKQILFTGLLVTYEQNQMLHSSRLPHSAPEWTPIDRSVLFRSLVYSQICGSSHSVPIIWGSSGTWFNHRSSRSNEQLFSSSCHTQTFYSTCQSTMSNTVGRRCSHRNLSH